MVTPPLFWSLVSASFHQEDHQDKEVQKMVVTCLCFVRQRPEDYRNFLVNNSIKVPSSLKRSLIKTYQRRTPKKGPGKKAPRRGISSRSGISSRLPRYEGNHRGELEGRNRSGAVSTGNESEVSGGISDDISVFSCMSREGTSKNFVSKWPANIALAAEGGGDGKVHCL